MADIAIPITERQIIPGLRTPWTGLGIDDPQAVIRFDTGDDYEMAGPVRAPFDKRPDGTANGELAANQNRRYGGGHAILKAIGSPERRLQVARHIADASRPASAAINTVQLRVDDSAHAWSTARIETVDRLGH